MQEGNKQSTRRAHLPSDQVRCTPNPKVGVQEVKLCKKGIIGEKRRGWVVKQGEKIEDLDYRTQGNLGMQEIEKSAHSIQGSRKETGL